VRRVDHRLPALAEEPLNCLHFGVRRPEDPESAHYVISLLSRRPRRSREPPTSRELWGAEGRVTIPCGRVDCPGRHCRTWRRALLRSRERIPGRVLAPHPAANRPGDGVAPSLHRLALALSRRALPGFRIRHTRT